MRPAGMVVGALLAVGGAIWTVQGAGKLHGSFMTGSVFWERTGVATLLVGLTLFSASLWMGRSRGPRDS